MLIGTICLCGGFWCKGRPALAKKLQDTFPGNSISQRLDSRLATDASFTTERESELMQMPRNGAVGRQAIVISNSDLADRESRDIRTSNDALLTGGDVGHVGV
jgi:hypothetical protein